MNPSHNNAILHTQPNVTQQTTEQQSPAVTKSILRSITPENSQTRTATIAATAESFRHAPSRRVTFGSVSEVEIPASGKGKSFKAYKEAQEAKAQHRQHQQQQLANAQAQIQQLQAQMAALQAQLKP